MVPVNPIAKITVLLLFVSQISFGSDKLEEKPNLSIGEITSPIVIDGNLSENDWGIAPFIDDMLMVEPIQGGTPTSRTIVKLIANEKFLIIGVECMDSDPSSIVRHSTLRDERLQSEDHIRIVIDPSLDGQSGYIFQVNANGARYDALVSNRGERENSDWDAIWEASSRVHENGWTTEIKIPVQSLNFKKGLKTWGFNIERKIQRLQETIRWANVRQDQWFTQTSRAGLISNLPEFSYGIGLNVRPSVILNSTKNGENENTDISLEPSLDFSQRIGSNIVASVTLNTDFAETEVDTRRTNLTRFPLFFPEKRAFFLEGADIFEFGLGLGGRSMMPFFSRRIGLYSGEQIPILAGGKVNGRIGNTAFGALTVRTKAVENEELNVPDATMGVFRIRQNILGESSIGYIGTFGEASGISNTWTQGIDFTYQTTSFRGNKNFLAGFWGMYAQQDGLEGDKSAVGFKIDYPNDLWDWSITYMRVGESFDPALGFVPRKNINMYRVSTIYSPRPNIKWLRQMRNIVFLTYYTNLANEWESYSFYFTPINWQLESGDRIELKFNPKGEFLTEPFEISDGVVIPGNEGYHFIRYGLEARLAAKRKISGELNWGFGPFYEGTLNEIQMQINWNPIQFLTFEFVAGRNIVRLPYENGAFNQTIYGTRIRLNITTDLQFNSFIQYDNESKEIGVNSRLHWIFHPQGDFFLVFNNNSIKSLDRWALDTRQLLAKFRYNFRL